MIPITRAITLSNYVQVLRSIGAPVESGLKAASLPILYEETPDIWLPYHKVRTFIGNMATSEGIPDLGLRTIKGKY